MDISEVWSALRDAQRELEEAKREIERLRAENDRLQQLVSAPGAR
jgi:hypothetical protein